MGKHQLLYVLLNFGLFVESWHVMNWIKTFCNEILLWKTWQEPKTVIFTELQAMHKISTDYGLLCLISKASKLRKILGWFFWCASWTNFGDFKRIWRTLTQKKYKQVNLYLKYNFWGQNWPKDSFLLQL